MARKTRRLPQFPEPGPPMRQPPTLEEMLARPDPDAPRPPLFNGRLYPPEKLEALRAYLDRRGVDLLVGDEHLPRGLGGYFQCNPGGRHVLALPSNPTCYVVWHEMTHYLHCRKIGAEAYVALRREPGYNEAEQVVFDFLSNGKRWGQLNDEERWAAIDYIEGEGDPRRAVGFR